jgi:hypothetical protein
MKKKAPHPTPSHHSVRGQLRNHKAIIDIAIDSVSNLEVLVPALMQRIADLENEIADIRQDFSVHRVTT